MNFTGEDDQTGNEIDSKAGEKKDYSYMVIFEGKKTCW